MACEIDIEVTVANYSRKIIIFQGKSDPYCEVSMGVQEHRTRVINNTLNPRWNASMQFTIKDPQQDVLCITVYDRDLFTPNGRHHLLLTFMHS